MADGLEQEDGKIFSSNEIALHGALIICDADCNEIRACMMERLGGTKKHNENDFNTLIERMLEISPYRFCLERLEQRDLRRLLSNPSFLREAHRRWASDAGFHIGPIVAKEPNWNEAAAKAVRDLSNAAATVEEVETLVVQESNRCLNLARKILGKNHDAEDVCQEAFLRAIVHAEKLEMDRNPRAWLSRVVRNLCWDYLKSRRFIVSLSDADFATVFEPTDRRDDIGKSDLAEYFATVVQPRVDQLSLEQRQVLELHFWGGLSVAEIAAHFGIPDQTIYSRKKRGLEKLSVLCATSEIA